MITDPIGLYVHIPFCKSKCNYCDFVSFSGALQKYEDIYVDKLIDEIIGYETEDKLKANTIFFGGGTPSVISATSFEKIVNALSRKFTILQDAEFTVEANPKTLTPEKLEMYKKLGVNRISMGLQSIHENELKILGRIHSFDDFLKSYELCYRHGIENLNLDLMYGIPSQTPASFRKTLDTIAAIDPKHISAYGLILEEGTRFFEIKDSLQFPSEEEEFEMYRMASDILSGKGYSHYEISNYAKEGFECKHNLKYWHDEQYIGFGLSAHSYFNGKRYSNHVEFSEYFSPQREQYISEQILTVDDQAYEYAMLRLRLSEGFSLSEYERKFSRSFLKGKEKFVDSLISLGYVTVFADRIALTESGFYVSNSILSELL